jgi:hypothetical protein
MWRGLETGERRDSINRILGALLGKPLLLLNDVICMFAILITDSADSKKALKKTS